MSPTTTPTATPPPATPSYLLSYPSPHVLLVTINRPRAMNSIPYAAHWEAAALFDWFDEEPSLRVAVITGAGDRAFCAGQDLIEQDRIKNAATNTAGAGTGTASAAKPPRQMLTHPPSGFMGVSRRVGKKPIIAAVNGYAMGGGFEITLNCDMVIASPNATFALPEASRGLYAAAGGLARIVRICGLPVAAEVAMAGRRLSAEEALRFNLVNRVSKTPGSVVDEAVELARKVASFSPDAIIVTRHGLREAWETGSVERAAQRTDERYGAALREGENLRIGLEAFKKKAAPQWVGSKL